MLDARQARADADVVGDHPVFHRHVQIYPDENPLTFECEVVHIEDGHCLVEEDLLGVGKGYGRIEHPVRESPLIVVPRQHLHQPTHYFRE